LGNDTTQQTQRTFARANLLQICCGLVVYLADLFGLVNRISRQLVTDLLRGNWYNGFWPLPSCLKKTRSSVIAVLADRTACSILTLFIAIATCRPLNKKNPFAVSPRIQLRICVRNPQSAHGTLSLPYRHGRPQPAKRRLAVMVQCRVSLLTNESCRFDDHAHCCLNPHSTLMAFLTFYRAMLAQSAVMRQ